jgi:hypothetical protein
MTITNLTKLEVAEREIVAAIQLFFDGSDPIAVHVVAAAARVITSALCEHRNIKSFLDDVRDQYPGLSKAELYKMANRHANFFKHAEDDPDCTLQEFDEMETASVLFIAGHDLGLLCGRKPLEVEVLELWFLALHMPSKLPSVSSMFLLPSFNGKSLAQQIEAGKDLLDWARKEPDLIKTHSRK